MALINHLEKKSIQRPRKQGETKATYDLLQLGDELILQINTSGSPHRKYKGKDS